LIDEGHEDASQFTDLIHDLTQRWQQLKQAVEHRRKMLLQSEKAQQVYLLIKLISIFFTNKLFCILLLYFIIKFTTYLEKIIF